MSSLSSDQLARVEEVRSEQMRLGMQPRNDSILTYNFAIQKIDEHLNDATKVAQELYHVDYIYKNTEYASIVEDVMREIARLVHFKYKLDWNTAWEIVRFYVPDMLKMYCIHMKTQDDAQQQQVSNA